MIYIADHISASALKFTKTLGCFVITTHLYEPTHEPILSYDDKMLSICHVVNKRIQVKLCIELSLRWRRAHWFSYVSGVCTNLFLLRFGFKMIVAGGLNAQNNRLVPWQLYIILSWMHTNQRRYALRIIICDFQSVGLGKGKRNWSDDGGTGGCKFESELESKPFIKWRESSNLCSYSTVANLLCLLHSINFVLPCQDNEMSFLRDFSSRERVGDSSSD